MDDKTKINLSELPELKTKGGCVIRELFFSPSTLRASELEGSYPLKGAASVPGGCRQSNIDWRIDGLTQDPISREMAWEPYDTPHLDITPESLALIHQHLTEQRLLPH